MTKSKLVLMLIPAALVIGEAAVAENIDPANNGARYAWAENVGWLNTRPLGTGGPGVQVADFELTGWIWGENIGWVSLSCENVSCVSVFYGVGNDTYGHLSGFAWAENVGWVNFGPPTAGITIDPTTGDFSGRAWGENIGWISFASAGPLAYKVNTAWRCNPNPGPVGNTLQLSHDRFTGRTTVTWSPIVSTAHYNTYRGSIPVDGMGSRLLPYDHTCFESDDAGGDGSTQSRDPASPMTGTAFYYLVSGEATCEGPVGNASNGSSRPNFNACPSP